MMKRYAMPVLAALAVTACGSNPGGPSDTQSNTVVFTAALSPANETPPVTNGDATGRGTGTFTLNLTRDSAGTITDATGTFVYTLTGFPAGTSVILTHIHEAGPGVPGSVVINTGLSPATAITLADGTLNGQTFANRPVGATLANQIIANPNGYYFNVHTGLNPGGAVRAQLVKQ
jgi:hypothetical protein